MTHDELFQFMSSQKLGVLGSVSQRGEPQSALVGIAVTPALEIIFDTVASSRKHTNLRVNPAASFVIGLGDPATGEKTVQLEGFVRQPEGAELTHYQKVYFTAYPDGPQRMSWPGIAYFVVRPRWIRYSDYDQNPPFIQEFRFE